MTSAKTTQPALAELMLAYLSQPADLDSATARSEVEPYDSVLGLRADPREAWKEALAALSLSANAKIPAPGEWGGMVVRQDAMASVAFASGNYPQRVREITQLLQSEDLTKLRPTGSAQTASASLRNWAQKLFRQHEFPQLLAAVGVLRAAGDFAEAERILVEAKALASTAEADLLGNEEGAWLWHQGKAEEAIRLWDGLPESAPVLFNRGMAALFSNQPGKARECLRKAMALLTEDDPWHHLAGLYLALAEMR